MADGYVPVEQVREGQPGGGGRGGERRKEREVTFSFRAQPSGLHPVSCCYQRQPTWREKRWLFGVTWTINSGNHLRRGFAFSLPNAGSRPCNG